MPAALAVIVAAAAAQVILGRWIISPWWMPDLLLLGLAAGLLRAPDHRITVAAAAAAAAALWSGPGAAAPVAGYLAAGAVLIWSSDRWDVQASWLRLIPMAVAEVAILTACWMRDGALMSWLLLGDALGRILLTVACWQALRCWSSRAISH